MDEKRRRRNMARLWAELLADMFDNDVFFDVMSENMRPEPAEKTPVGQFTLGKSLGLGSKKIVGESVTEMGDNSFSVSPVVFDEALLDPEISDDELIEMEEEENEQKKKDD
jgi:hypothetical protein|tara:strand:+ start:327 stop:659 length:333 start_codon:yes stop_codon:yes gene_type:complete